MSAPVLGPSLMITITSTTTAIADDGVEFNVLDPHDLRDQIFDYAHHVAQVDDSPVQVVLHNQATDRSDTVLMQPTGSWAIYTPGVDTSIDDDDVDDCYDVASGDDEGYEAYADQHTAASPEDAADAESMPTQTHSDDVTTTPLTAHPLHGVPTPDDRYEEAVADVDDLDDVPVVEPSPPRRATRTNRPQRSGPSVPRPPRVTSHDETASTSVWRRHRKPLIGVGALVVVGAVIAAVVLGHVIGRADTNTPAKFPAPSAASAQSLSSDEIECPTKTNGEVSTGRGPGNQSSGVEVIKAFNWAYYQWRNASAARAMVSADGKVGSVIGMQAAIDVLTPGLRYCLAITDEGGSNFGVQITEIPPNDGQQRVIKQDVHTENIGGRYWITSFAKPKSA